MLRVIRCEHREGAGFVSEPASGPRPVEPIGELRKRHGRSGRALEERRAERHDDDETDQEAQRDVRSVRSAAADPLLDARGNEGPRSDSDRDGGDHAKPRLPRREALSSPHEGLGLEEKGDVDREGIAGRALELEIASCDRDTQGRERDREAPQRAGLGAASEKREQDPADRHDEERRPEQRRGHRHPEQCLFRSELEPTSVVAELGGRPDQGGDDQERPSEDHGPGHCGRTMQGAPPRLRACFRRRILA